MMIISFVVVERLTLVSCALILLFVFLTPKRRHDAALKI